MDTEGVAHPSKVLSRSCLTHGLTHEASVAGEPALQDLLDARPLLSASAFHCACVSTTIQYHPYDLSHSVS